MPRAGRKGQRARAREADGWKPDRSCESCSSRRSEDRQRQWLCGQQGCWWCGGVGRSSPNCCEADNETTASSWRCCREDRDRCSIGAISISCCIGAFCSKCHWCGICSSCKRASGLISFAAHWEEAISGRDGTRVEGTLSAGARGLVDAPIPAEAQASAAAVHALGGGVGSQRSQQIGGDRENHFTSRGRRSVATTRRSASQESVHRCPATGSCGTHATDEQRARCSSCLWKSSATWRNIGDFIRSTAHNASSDPSVHASSAQAAAR